MPLPRFRYFGFEIKKTTREQAQDVRALSVAPPLSDAQQVSSPGAFFPQFSMNSSQMDSAEYDLINRYRAMEQDPVVSEALEDIVNEAIVFDDGEQPVNIDISNASGLSEFITEKIQKEFENVLELLNFRENGDTLFRRWYVDGRIIFHKIIDHNHPEYGLLEVRRIEPYMIKRMQFVESTDPNNTQGIILYKGKPKTYYAFTPNGFSFTNISPQQQSYGAYAAGGLGGAQTTAVLNITEDSIAFIPSGLIDYSRGGVGSGTGLGGVVVSYLNTALKPWNQLGMMEDLMVIYQITRSIDRRVFHVDVGGMHKRDAEVYMQEQVDRYRTTIAYDTTSGQLTSKNKYMAIQEDIWVPKTSNTDWAIDTLEGGSAMEANKANTDYFKDKLYRSLHVPPSRLGEDKHFRIGNPNDINRDEVRFSKFINKVRGKFSHLFLDLLKTQLILKGVCTPDNWDELLPFLKIVYKHDVYFAELKNSEILKGRIDMVNAIEPLLKRGWFSENYVRTKILQQTSEEIAAIEDEISKEGAKDQSQETPQASSIDFSLPGSSPTSSSSAPPEAPTEAPPEFDFGTETASTTSTTEQQAAAPQP